MDAREVALLTLNTCHRQGGWSDGVLKKQLADSQLDGRDAALATQICFGILQNQILIDFYLSHFSKLPLKRMESRVVEALRIGVYQMLFLDKIPHRAAVDSAVNLVKKHSKNQRAAGMVNGILRNFSRQIDALPEIPAENPVAFLSIKYSHPQWLVQEYLDTLGQEGAEAVLQANNSQPPMTAMTNTTKISTEELLPLLEVQGVTAQPHPWLLDCLILSDTGNLEKLTAFQEGLFYIQDVASRLAILAAMPKRDGRLLDTCSAPGGKSFAAAIFKGNQGEIISCDIHPHKKKLIQNGADRLGLTSITPHTADGRSHQPQWEGGFDTVIVDVPCSGLGVIRKKPDIRYKDAKPLGDLPQIQGDILENACRYVAPGGTLLYSTCTTLHRENGEIIANFLRNHSDFRKISFELPKIGLVETGEITLWPHIHGTDGFFIAKLHREENP